KKDLGLPHVSSATDPQRANGMCWTDENELYNDGRAFKITARDMDGVMVTLLADNYFGYCKKEVKTQIGFAANLFGVAEEEHAGGTLAFSSYSLGEQFSGLHPRAGGAGYRFEEAMKLLGDDVDVHADGHATDRRFPFIRYIREDVHIDLAKQDI